MGSYDVNRTAELDEGQAAVAGSQIRTAVRSYPLMPLATLQTEIEGGLSLDYGRPTIIRP